MGTSTFRGFLAPQVQREDEAEARSPAVRQTWVSAVARLLDRIESRLRIREERIGTDQLDGLLMRLGAVEVWTRRGPGMSGRV